jgi:hypothetical protein
MATVRGIQRYHIDGNGFADIGYSWLVDQLGNVYEGRGWLRQGAHTFDHNSTSHGIAWLGDSTKLAPSNAALAAIAQCIVDGQKAGAVSMDCTIGGHRDANADTACPGDGLYRLLPVIRSAVLDLPPANTDPPEEEDMTPEQDARLREVHFWLGQGYVAGGVVTAMRPDMDALGRKIDAIGGVADLSKIPTAALAAELCRRAGVTQETPA